MSRLASSAWSVLVTVAARARPDVVFSVPTSRPIFALTLDDGPDAALTPRVLNVLGKHHAHATFFLIGSRAREHPDIVARIRAEGHEIGNHMWHDERASGLLADEFVTSLLMTEKALGGAASVSLLRPGSGFVSKEKTRLARAYGYRCVLGSIYPFDAHVRSWRWSYWIVRKLMRPGSIVILHEGASHREAVIAVIDNVLEAARNRGLAATTVGELLDHHRN